MHKIDTLPITPQNRWVDIYMGIKLLEVYADSYIYPQIVYGTKISSFILNIL